MENNISNINARLLPRWKKLLVGIRMFCPFVDMESIEGFDFDRKILSFKYENEVNLHVTDSEGTLHIIFSEDGQPNFLSDWAEEAYELEPYDIELWERA